MKFQGAVLKEQGQTFAIVIVKSHVLQSIPQREITTLFKVGELAKLGQPYNLINYNCESFVNDILLEKVHSNQVRNILGLLALVVIIGVIFKN